MWYWGTPLPVAPYPKLRFLCSFSMWRCDVQAHESCLDGPSWTGLDSVGHGNRAKIIYSKTVSKFGVDWVITVLMVGEQVSFAITFVNGVLPKPCATFSIK